MKRHTSWRGTCCDYWQKDDTGLAVDLAGKTALVTGASSGIGRATALALAAAGARVALTRRSEARLGEVAGIIGAREVVLPADLAVAGACAAVVTRAQAALGRIDILIANAGLYVPGEGTTGDPADWGRMLAANVQAVWPASNAAASPRRAFMTVAPSFMILTVHPPGPDRMPP